MTREEFEDLVTGVGLEVYGFCLQLTRNREEAEELYQETMLAAMERHKKIDMRRNPKSYLIGITVGLWKNFRRKIARRNRIHPETSLEETLAEIYPADNTPSPEEEMMECEQRRQLQRLVAQLPEKLQIPVYLYYSRELSVDEIAVAMHIPKGTVKSRLYKARKLIKDRMEAEEYGIS